MTDTTKQIAGVDIERLMRNLNDTSYQEGVMDLACRLSDCKAVIEELLAARATPVSPAQNDLAKGLQTFAEELLAAAKTAPAKPQSDLHSAGTIDTPEFRELLGHLQRSTRSIAFTTAVLIAYIMAWHSAGVAAAVSDLQVRYEANTAIMHARTKRMNEAHARIKELETALAAAREQALEEAAQIAMTHNYTGGGLDAARAIRALKASPASVGAQVAGEPVYFAQYQEVLGRALWLETTAEDYATWNWHPHTNYRKLYTAPVPAQAATSHPVDLLKIADQLEQIEADKRGTDDHMLAVVLGSIATQLRVVAAAPVPAPATVDRDAVLEEAKQACIKQNDTDWPTPLGCADAIEKLKGKAAPAPVAVAPVAGEGLTDSTPELRTTLKEIVLCYPWGTDSKLVRDNTTRNWHIYHEPTAKSTYLSERANNLVNSAIAATRAILAERQPQPAAQAAVPEGDLVRAGWFLYEGIEWTPTSSDDPRATILYRIAAPAAVPQGVEAQPVVKACPCTPLMRAGCSVCAGYGMGKEGERK